MISYVSFFSSITFFNPIVGEFWYGLELTALPPRPTDLPDMNCELGRWVRQPITLQNPTNEVLQLISTVSNSNNFLLERDDDLPIEMGPQSSLTMTLRFMPSDLGEADHQARIAFLCEQVHEDDAIYVYFYNLLFLLYDNILIILY